MAIYKGVRAIPSKIRQAMGIVPEGEHGAGPGPASVFPLRLGRGVYISIPPGQPPRCTFLQRQFDAIVRGILPTNKGRGKIRSFLETNLSPFQVQSPSSAAIASG